MHPFACLSGIDLIELDIASRKVSELNKVEIDFKHIPECRDGEATNTKLLVETALLATGNSLTALHSAKMGPLTCRKIKKSLLSSVA